MENPTYIFGNPVSHRVTRRARNARRRFARKFGQDGPLGLRCTPLPVLGELWGCTGIAAEPGDSRITLKPHPIIIGTIRMGYGHFRISMAIASAAASQGLAPYWFDLHAQTQTTAGKVIGHLNSLYSLGSRLSQRSALFNRLYWEPLNSKAFRKLSYNAIDQETARLYAPVWEGLPKDVPVVATHVWPAQAAIHAGMTGVVNVVPDNWPMALHLAQGSLHTVQTPHAYWGYRSLRGMGPRPGQLLHPMPGDDVLYTGHYIDHELVSTLEDSTARRLERLKNREPLRLLMTVGGAGAQADFYLQLIDRVAEAVRSRRIELHINVGDHRGVRDQVAAGLADMNISAELMEGRSSETPPGSGIHRVYYSPEIYSGVYLTNSLMPHCDVLVTKPSELSFYPIPKLMIRRIGGHEAWGAIHGAELGDSTPECRRPQDAAQFLGLMLEDGRALELMNRSILAAHTQGIYNGAYRVVQAALARAGAAAGPAEVSHSSYLVRKRL